MPTLQEQAAAIGLLSSPFIDLHQVPALGSGLALGALLPTLLVGGLNRPAESPCCTIC